ncbi:PKHD1, partial [Symbiodinium natans]
MDAVFLKNLTINGKLSFDDSRDRTLTTGSILLWGLLEIGTPQHPFGKDTGSKVTIRLSGDVLNTEDYVYIQEQSLWGKVIAVIGQVKTYGAPIADTWLRLAQSIGASEETACVMNATGPVDWPAGTEVAFSVTEFDNPWGRTLTRTLTQDTAYDEDNDCWRIHWSGNLNERRFAGDVPVSDTKTVSLRAVVARIDRSVVFTSAYIDTTGGSAYGGHMEIFDVALGDLAGSSVVGEVDMKYTRFHNLGKGALSAAVKVTFASSFEPPPVLIFHGCSWTSSVEYALHLESSNVPVLITNNVIVQSLNGGIFLQEGAGVQMKDNAILGIKMADTAPRAIAEDEDQVIVIQYAGIRADVMPVRMIGNIVSGSNDMGFMHPAESCPPRAIFNNEAVGTITGVFLHTQKSGVCQTINLYTIWKTAHVALYLSDVIPPQTMLSNIVIADSHIGIIPYMSVGSAFRRLYLRNVTFIGTSPAGTDCSVSNHCRTQTLTDPYANGCSSMYTGAGFRRVGFVTPIQTKNRKSCWTTKPAYQCRLMSPAQPTLTPCHQPWEKDIHMQKGLGWTYFEDTTFAHWKSSDCGMSDRAIAPNLWGAEVNFPATFTRTTWYESDPGARFELSTDALDSAYAARASPCKSSGGGCMGLDQLLFQDTDGTLTGVDAPNATVLPLTPRTDIVWAPFCETQLFDVNVGVQVCGNLTVDLLEMVNLDRGAKDIKFGPLVLTPDVEEDNGFEGGVLSSVGPFYASCPCGWDFSFYHILIKPDTTYYAEVMSLPENFRLRYWSPRPDDSVLLEIFYPDSRGVNVFVGGAKEPDMALKLGRKPTLDDEHGAHVVDAQALRLYITLRGSTAGFNAQRDLVVRRTPTVKLKMNIEISIEEFNAEQFQTNLAILLGIPPERIVVAAVQVRRRLALVDTTEADLEMSQDSDEMCPTTGCQTPGRRLAVVSSTALDVSIEPSPDAAAAASGGDSASTGSDALNAQASELNQVSTNLQALGGTDLASAAGGEVSITEVQTPAEPDEANNEQVPSLEETTEAQVIDITAVAESTAAAEVSAEASCPTNFGILVTVGFSQGIVYPSAELATGNTETSLCANVDSGFEGSILLSCNSGVLKANSGSCVPKGCSDPVDVTVGSATTSISPQANMASGVVSTQACTDVSAGFTGSYELYCSMGVLTYDASTCSPGCNASQSVAVTVAGSSTSWSPSAAMGSGETSSVSCEPINSGYSGTIQISCFFGVLSANPAGCGPKQCDVGDVVSVTLDGVTATLALARAIQSGLTATRSCSDVNDAWGADLTLSCNLGTLSSDVTSCLKACSASDSLDITVDGSTQTVNPAATIASGAAEYNRACSELNSGYQGTYTMFCNLGVLSADTSFCEAKGCSDTATVNVDVGGATSVVATGATLLHGESIDQLCEEVNPQYTGTLSIDCAFGTASLASQTCAVKPCEPWDFVAASLHGASGLLQPREQILSGESGIGECGNVNIEYSGDFTMTCNLGVLEAGDSSACRRTCSPYGSNTTVTVEGEVYVVWPIRRIPHLGTGVQACGNVLFGFGGEVEMACDDGTLTVLSHNCQPEPCEAGLLIQTTIYGVTGIAPLMTSTPHLGTGLVNCYSINPETTGWFEATCLARTLTLVSETACRKSCTDTSPATLQIDGYDYTVLPVGTIPHNRSHTQNCSAFWPGYEGTIDMQCIDDVASVVDQACIPLPCPDPRMDDENYTETERTLPPYSVYFDNCSTIREELVGEIKYTCLGGQVRPNVSACGAPCNASEQDPDLHGSEAVIPCYTFISSMYDGNAFLSCDDGVYKPNITGCQRACLPGEMTTVVVAGDVYDDVTVTDRLSSGVVEQRNCSLLDSGYHGILNLTCSNGLLTDSHSCHKLCLTSSSVDVSIGGNVLPVSPVSQIEHDQTGLVSCGSVVAGYTGDVVLTCNEGTITADTSACMGACSLGQSLSVTFAGEAKGLTLSSEIPHGQTGIEGCSRADSGFTGNLVIACSDGVATLSSESCQERSCAEDLSWQMTLGSMTVTKALDAEVNHAGIITLNCSEVNMEWDNEIAVTCIKGALIPDYSDCKPACMPDYGTPLLMGLENVTVSPDNRMADGDTFVKQCSDFGSQHQGTMLVTCSLGTLSVDSSCLVGCGASQIVQANLDWQLFVTDIGQVILHSQSADVDCPDGFSGSMTVNCDAGVATVDMPTSCEPLPCPGGTTNYLEYDFVGRDITSEAFREHNASYTLECAFVNPAFRGDFQVVCKYGNLTGDFSTCIGDPCLYGASVEAFVGWQSAVKESPYGQVEHGTTWTEDCGSINSEFSGDMMLTCVGGNIRYDPSTCVQLEVGCLPTGEGAEIMLGNDTKVVRTTSAVALGQAFTLDCSEVDSNWVGTISGTCGSKGSYVGLQVNCIPQACAAGLPSNVTKGGIFEVVSTSMALSHAQTEIATCESANEALRGELRLTCHYGVVLADASSCELFCLPSRPGQVILGGSVHSVVPPQAFQDPYGLDCSLLMSGFSGQATVRCNGGAVDADVSACAAMPCPSSSSASVTLYDQTQTLMPSQELTSGSAETVNCSSVNPVYAGSIELRCFAAAMTVDIGGCVCQDQSCSTAPCQTGDTFVVDLSGIRKEHAMTETLGALNSTVLTCDAVVPGHDGNVTVLCTGGILKANSSACAARGCSSSTPAQQVIVGGATGAVTTDQELLHTEHFVWDNCSSLDTGYKGVINTTCYLGEFVVDGGSCVPQPCDEDVREVVVAGLALTVRLTGSSLGSTSPAPHGFQGTGDCAQLDDNLIGSFSVGCTASEFSLELGQCVLNTCEPPSTAVASVGGATQSGSLVLDEQYEHNCPNTSDAGDKCDVSCARGYGGESTKLRCWSGAMEPIGDLPSCVQLPVYVAVTGTIDLQVNDPQAFIRDESVQQGVAAGIANTFN